MAIYELEERNYFDGAAPLDVGEVSGDSDPGLAEELSSGDSITYLVSNISGNSDTENSLPWAVEQANEHPGSDFITFDSLINGLPITTDELLEITDDLTITGNDSTNTIVQAAETAGIADHSVFLISHGNVLIKNLTVRYGYSEISGGGGIRNDSNLELLDADIFGNYALWGGGVANLGDVSIDNCSIQGNEAMYGGGILNAGSMEIKASDISNNYASMLGGGIYNENFIIVETTVIAENTAGMYGGGIYSSYECNLLNSNILNNLSFYGGGIYNNGSFFSVVASDIFYNDSTVSGGGIFNDGFLVVSDKSNIDNNSSIENGGGILNGVNGTAQLITSSITSNTSEFGGGLYNDGIVSLNSMSISSNTAAIYGNNNINGEDIPAEYLLTDSPNDPFYNELWGMKNISANEVWNNYTGSRNIIVAVLDSGVDYNHPDLIDNMRHNPGEIPDNGIDDDNNGYIDDYWGWNFLDNNNNPMDDHGHGTHCAGTIGAVGNNGIGVAGVCWNVQIMAIKIYDDVNVASTQDIENAIRYAVDMGTNVISCSWGGAPEFWDFYLLAEVFKYAKEHDVLAVIAAGNESSNNDINPIYPASLDISNIISVAASGSYFDINNIAPFSNYGAVSVDFAAPGVGILSTVPYHVSGKYYDYYDGTSMATPMVSGAAALIWSQFPELTYDQVKYVLMNGVDKGYDLAEKCVMEGRLNLQSSYKLAWRIIPMFNDGTEFTTFTSWRSSIDDTTGDLQLPFNRDIKEVATDNDFYGELKFNTDAFTENLIFNNSSVEGSLVLDTFNNKVIDHSIISQNESNNSDGVYDIILDSHNGTKTQASIDNIKSVEFNVNKDFYNYAIDKILNDGNDYSDIGEEICFYNKPLPLKSDLDLILDTV